jgi:nicotinate phosphoribosyltransferase
VAGNLVAAAGRLLERREMAAGKKTNRQNVAIDGDGGRMRHAALFTDLYELTMLQSYLQAGMDRLAVFELTYRNLPENRNFIMAAGLDRVLGFLEALKFTGADLDYLRTQPPFRESFLAELNELRFTGDVYAVPEGALVFPHEPLVQVVASLPEAQLVETLVLNQIGFASLAASKAARCVLAADGRMVVDFGSRRAHGIDAALTVAWAAYLAGADGTSLVEAGRHWGIPIFGTMAHSYIQAHDDEQQAFRDFAELYPNTTLLVDTYDTLAGVRSVIELSRQMGDDFNVRAIRLDSGDLLDLSRTSRTLLDEAGLHQVKIFASSGLDEYALESLVTQHAPIDGFGVGTALAVSADAPALDLAYKLVQYDGKPRTKFSPGKVIYPGRKQVFRSQRDGEITGDVLAHHDADRPGAPLLKHVMSGGRRLEAGRSTLEEARRRAGEALSSLPAHLKRLLTAGVPYPVEIDEGLQAQLAELRHGL